ncbi:(2,3-dihydroxybenzoyl)adenylate synthase [Ottowia sp.]|uniref:(2,3-dihydroxybenzoyl)adenylate synthase n=1 Tax=Ottowia sp. TaxID=1898956 RepID=UPI003A863D81
MSETFTPLPLKLSWPPEFQQRYRAAGHWRSDTFPAMLRTCAGRFAERIAVVAGDDRWTYAALWQRAENLAAGLLAHGLTPGERVVVQLGNTATFYAVVWALFRAGLIPVYALAAHRITEIAHFVRKAEAAAYIAPERCEGYDYRLLARELKALPDVPTLRHIFIAGDAAEFTALSTLQGDAALLPTTDPDPQSVAFLQISGGSTGLSKLIPRTHDDYIYSFRASNDICGITQDSVYMVALPAAHNFPMSSPGALGTFYAGGTVVLSPSPSPDVAFALIERERVTDLGLVPPLALLWAQAAATTKHDLSSLRVLQVGGAKLTPEAARRVVAGLPVKLQQVFGMAEGLVNYTRLDDDEDTILTTQGRPISADDEVLVVDDAGQPVPHGEVGHLLTRGPYTIRAYHNEPAANARSFTEDGFYRTGDMVLRLPSGHLVVQGRAYDHINRAGEKISAEEVEDHLLAHPQVFDVAVVSIPDDYLGERSCAFVIARSDVKPRVPEIKAWMRQRGVAAFKVPDQVVFVEAFEITAVGKTSRKELRARLRAEFLDQPTPKS